MHTQIYLSPLLLLVTLIFSISAFAIPPGTNDEIKQRIAPVGYTCRQSDSCAKNSPTTPVSEGVRDSLSIYTQYCSICHLTGVAGAPKITDKTAWAQRLALGLAELYNTTINGKGGMPPRGTCLDCNNEELQATVQYMLNESGNQQ